MLETAALRQASRVLIWSSVYAVPAALLPLRAGERAWQHGDAPWHDHAGRHAEIQRLEEKKDIHDAKIMNK